MKHDNFIVVLIHENLSIGILLHENLSRVVLICKNLRNEDNTKK